ncbi:hypothetical protein [Pseudomonas sp.]|uniref:HNH endonuclease n=1 Tax=Pseudomonas sp. TaxID=306 RepID=UPI0028AC629D|nr:hypothetical protein [Pseudomonas sp.]
MHQDDDPYGFNLARPLPIPRPWLRNKAPPKTSDASLRRAELYVDLVPASAWYSNLRSELHPNEWREVKRFVARRAGHRCQICGGVGPKWPVECHEHWRFDEGTGIQTLVGLEALCPACHESTHIGYARERGRFKEASEHLMQVNSWSNDELHRHLRATWHVYERLSLQPWLLDARLVLSLPIKWTEPTRVLIERHAKTALASAQSSKNTDPREALLAQLRGIKL